MNEYLLKKKSLLDALASAGNDISEDDQILYILSGLNADYDAFVISMTTRTKSIKIQDVCTMLLAHESRIDQHNTSIDKTMQVNVSAKENGQKKTTSNGQHYTGYVQSTNGFSCPNPRNNNGGHGFNQRRRGRCRNFRGNSKPQCQICGKPGHLAA